MPYTILFSDDAERQFRDLTARQQRIIKSAVVAKLTHAPTTPTKAIKRLRANSVVEFQLRAEDFRVLYNVEDAIVKVIAIGRKVGNRLFVEGEEFHEHQDNPSEQPRSEPRSDA